MCAAGIVQVKASSAFKKTKLVRAYRFFSTHNRVVTSLVGCIVLGEVMGDRHLDSRMVLTSL